MWHEVGLKLFDTDSDSDVGTPRTAIDPRNTRWVRMTPPQREYDVMRELVDIEGGGHLSWPMAFFDTASPSVPPPEREEYLVQHGDEFRAWCARGPQAGHVAALERALQDHSSWRMAHLTKFEDTVTALLCFLIARCRVDAGETISSRALRAAFDEVEDTLPLSLERLRCVANSCRISRGQ